VFGARSLGDKADTRRNSLIRWSDFVNREQSRLLQTEHCVDVRRLLGKIAPPDDGARMWGCLLVWSYLSVRQNWNAR